MPDVFQTARFFQDQTDVELPTDEWLEVDLGFTAESLNILNDNDAGIISVSFDEGVTVENRLAAEESWRTSNEHQTKVWIRGSVAAMDYRIIGRIN